jgi:hypothetical protein
LQWFVIAVFGQDDQGMQSVTRLLGEHDITARVLSSY